MRPATPSPQKSVEDGRRRSKGSGKIFPPNGTENEQGQGRDGAREVHSGPRPPRTSTEVEEGRGGGEGSDAVRYESGPAAPSYEGNNVEEKDRTAETREVHSGSRPSVGWAPPID